MDMPWMARTPKGICSPTQPTVVCIGVVGERGRPWRVINPTVTEHARNRQDQTNASDDLAKALVGEDQFMLRWWLRTDG
jgi:hypothetical protein